MFEISKATFAALRRDRLSEALAATFQRSGFRTEASSDGATLAVTDACGRTTRLGFDAHGFVSQISSPSGRTTLLKNADTGALLSLATPGGCLLELVRKGDNVRVFIDSVAVGSIEQVELSSVLRHADGTAVELHRDNAGQLFRTCDRLGRTQTFEHDAVNRLRLLRDGRGRSTRFEYSGWAAHPTRIELPDGGTHEFLRGDNPSEYTVRLRGRNVYSVRPGSEPHSQQISYADGESLQIVRDAERRIVRARSRRHGVSYTRDDRQRVTKEQTNAGSVQFHYDDADSLIGMTYPDGQNISYEYDQDLRVSALVDVRGQRHVFQYASDDRGIVHHFPNGLRELTNTSSKGERLSTRLIAADGGECVSVQFAYDAESRITQLHDKKLGSVAMTYDAEGQLTQYLRARATPVSFAYDEAGNRTLCEEGTAAFDAMDQLVSQGGSQCSYDERGNLVSVTGEHGTWRYEFGCRDLLLAVTPPNAPRVTFEYDALGRRCRKQQDGREVSYVWAGDTLIQEVVRERVGRVETRTFIYLPGSNVPAAVSIGSQTYWYVHDQVGRPLHVVDRQGETVWSARYDAFGTAHVQTQRIAQNIRGAGQLCDDETGLYYNRFRYYSPRFGRYISRDPLSYASGRLNHYIYANNSPTFAVDPLGLFSWGAVGAAVAGVAAGAAVGALIVATAPVSLPALAVSAAAVLAGGAAGGAVGFALNEAMSQKSFDLPCILQEMGRGALIGAVAAAPFIFLPASAGVLAFMGIGAASGAIGYVSDGATRTGAEWSWKDFGVAVGVGAATAGLGRYIGGKFFPAKGATKSTTKPDPALVEGAGPAQEPVFVRPGEGVRPVTAKDAHPGRPMELDPAVSDRYMYIVKEDGTITYAPQKMAVNERGQVVETVKHTDLAESGSARTSGELNYDAANDRWIMDSNSGRYSAEQIPGTRDLRTNRSPENLESAAELARRTGTDSRISTPATASEPAPAPYTPPAQSQGSQLPASAGIVPSEQPDTGI